MRISKLGCFGLVFLSVSAFAQVPVIEPQGWTPPPPCSETELDRTFYLSYDCSGTAPLAIDGVTIKEAGQGRVHGKFAARSEDYTNVLPPLQQSVLDVGDATSVFVTVASNHRLLVLTQPDQKGVAVQTSLDVDGTQVFQENGLNYQGVVYHEAGWLHTSHMSFTTPLGEMQCSFGTDVSKTYTHVCP